MRSTCSDDVASSVAIARYFAGYGDQRGLIWAGGVCTDNYSFDHGG